MLGHMVIVENGESCTCGRRGWPGGLYLSDSPHQAGERGNREGTWAGSDLYGGSLSFWVETSLHREICSWNHFAYSSKKTALERKKDSFRR